jgi:FAD:protein FMN transferase
VKRLVDTVGALLRRSRARDYSSHHEHVLGTSLELHFVATGERSARVAEEVVLREIARLESVFSLHADTSELREWIATTGEPIPVSMDLARVLELSERWRILTGGAFDPRAALPGYWRDRSLPDTLPGTPADPGAGDQSPLWEIDYQLGGDVITARNLAGHRLTFDAVAKGYIAECACEAAQRCNGITDCVVNIGGDLRHRGEGRVRVGITDPFTNADNVPPIASVSISNQGVATSGGYRRAETVGGRELAHIVDPRTGRPADGVLSATVIAPTTTEADALATALSVLPIGEGLALVERLDGTGCLLVDPSGGRHASRFWSAHE